MACALGVKWLWIDAICINQTNPEAKESDWNREAVRMEAVFRGAYLTIAAVSAKNWGDGFLRLPLERRSVPHQDISNYEWDLDDEFNDFKKDVDGGLLNQRAWVMQERVLSRRILHFTQNHVYWECGEYIRCDDFRKLRWWAITNAQSIMSTNTAIFLVARGRIIFFTTQISLLASTTWAISMPWTFFNSSTSDTHSLESGRKQTEKLQLLA